MAIFNEALGAIDFDAIGASEIGQQRILALWATPTIQAVKVGLRSALSIIDPTTSSPNELTELLAWKKWSGFYTSLLQP